MGFSIRRVGFVLLATLVVQALAAESLSQRLSQIPDQHVQELHREMAVHRDLDSWREVELLPNHSLSERVREHLEEAKPNVLSERLTYVEGSLSDEEYLELYNSLRRVSEWSDIEYYNPQKDRWNPLFGRSFRVGSRSSDQALPDPVVSSIPARDEFLVLQDLEPFGETISRYSYTRNRNAFLFVGRNLTRITHRGFPVVGPNEMVTVFMVIREPDFTLVYGVGGANVFNFLGLLSGMIEEPFGNRTTGLLRWYSENYLTPLRRDDLIPDE